MGSAEPKPWAQLLASGYAAAQRADWAWADVWADLILAGHGNDGRAVLDGGTLHSEMGNVEKAEAAFYWAHQLLPEDSRPLANLAGCWLGSLRHQQALALYGQITARWPQENRHWHNQLMALAYGPDSTAAEGKALARQWAGQLAPAELEPSDWGQLEPLQGRKPRVGFLSADLCQHTVGLLLLPVVQAHDRSQFELFFYSASPQTDWVSEALQGCGTWRTIGADNDASVATQIRADRIDVLIELGGHTAGTRLAVLHQQAAPVQWSWLGYWGTTGLKASNGVILDPHAAPMVSEVTQSFYEPILRITPNRWCYKPVPWMPEPSNPPALKNGFITFGCFNNTAKINQRVIETWARILTQVPHSRLVLKWKTLRDQTLRKRLHQAFEQAGVESGRIELRGPSFHAQLLEEYGDVDIALDPFPFGGGLTSLESLWLGLPLVTLRCPNSGACAAGLQGTALLQTISRSEWIAENEQHYKDIAVGLAQEPVLLREHRSTLQQAIKQSGLGDGAKAWESLEGLIRGLD